jgi:geranylgeranyl pyrophosphate synthase
MHIGYAFDIQDDIIDTFAQEAQYGRPTCGDIAAGKKPLHIVYALNSANQEKSKILRAILGKKRLSQNERDLIRAAIRESGGLDAAKNTSKQHADEARTLITQTSLHDDVKEFFNSFISYIAENLDWYK